MPDPTVVVKGGFTMGGGAGDRSCLPGVNKSFNPVNAQKVYTNVIKMDNYHRSKPRSKSSGVQRVVINNGVCGTKKIF